VENSKFRIQVNKNKKILDHLTKFSQDLDQFRDKEGMSFLFYDFNGFKSSMSQRSNSNTGFPTVSSNNPGFPSSKKDTINTFKQNYNDIGSMNPNQTVLQLTNNTISGEQDILSNFNSKKTIKQISKK